MPDAQARPLRVFLCHSSNDKPSVRELYRQLSAEDWIDPWLDEEKLFPGMDWNLEIEKAVEAADAILVCLSKGSITKEGYIQRELRIVLDYADYKPEGTLYIFPIRLEDCELPRRLRPWQSTDYFPVEARDRAYQRLLVSLRSRAKALGILAAEGKAESVSEKERQADQASTQIIQGWADSNKKENPWRTIENKVSSVQSNIEFGSIDVGGDVGGSIIIGHGNVINLTPEQAVFRSLHQLPQPPADFTGREELIAQLLVDFKGGKGATTIGLTGMGGIGKTSLGLVVAHQVAKDYPDAQVFLDLKGTTTPLSAMDVMRHVILSFEPTMDLRALDETGMTSAYRSVLHGKRILLLLDNARSAEQIAPLRPPETCALFVTSRWTFTVPGLHSRRLDLMSEENAIAFLLELCPRVGEHAAGLARACGYLPLALRIAGSFLGVNEHWNVKEYLRQLHDRKGRLATLEQSREEAELRTEPDLLVTFELSYGQLSDDDKKRWRMLGVFPTSFDWAAASAMWDLDKNTTRTLLGLLLRYSLLDYDEASSRYSLHNLLADYALSQMKNGEEWEARTKHAFHYRDILSKADALYRAGGEKVLSGLHLFDLEWQNIREGEVWAAEVRENSPELSALCIAYSKVGVSLLALRQHPKERIQWLEIALSIARESGDRRSEGSVLGSLGTAYANLGELRTAIRFHEQALIIARESGNRGGEGNALGSLGNAYRLLGEVHKAIEFYEQWLSIAREIGDRRGEGSALGNLGAAYADLGELRTAIEFYEQQLAIAREIGNRHGESYALTNMGLAYAELGELHKAIESYEQVLIIARQVGDRRSEGGALDKLGAAYTELGEIHKAIEFHEQALIIVSEVGDRHSEGSTLANLGNAYRLSGELRKAIEFYEQSLVIARESGYRRGEGSVLISMGIAYANLGELRQAIESYEQALIIVRESGYRRGEAGVLFNMGLAWYALEAKDRAIHLVRQALEIYEGIESPYAEQAREQLKEWGALP